MARRLADPARGAGPLRSLPGPALFASLLAVFAAEYAWVRPTNFGGTDEWLCIDLVSRGILSVPYAHRPLVFLWQAASARFWPDSLWSYYFAHGTCLLLGAWTFALIVRRLVPGLPLLAFVAALIGLVWAPEDFLRLDTVLLTGYSGFTLGALLAVLLFLESYFHRSAALLALAALTGSLTVRGFEGALAIMGAAPLLLLWRERRPTPRFWISSLIWWGLLLALAAVVIADFLRAKQGAYQGSALALDPNPARVALRVLEQFGFHLLPLVRQPFPRLVPEAVLYSVAALCVGWALLPREARGIPGANDRRVLVESMAVGLLLAALGYLPLMLSASILQAARTQFLSAPGIGLFLGAAVLLAAGALPRGRPIAAGILAGFIVVSGASRTLAMQADWDAWRGKYKAQHRALTRLLELCPHVAPHTLFLLLDDAEAWPESFPFHHAVRYLYAGEASGAVIGATPFLYPLYPTPQGFIRAPWPVIRREWDEPVRLFRYDEIVVLRDRGAGPELVEAWPAAALGPLPAPARYAPRARLLETGRTVPSRRILEILPP